MVSQQIVQQIIIFPEQLQVNQPDYKKYDTVKELGSISICEQHTTVLVYMTYSHTVHHNCNLENWIFWILSATVLH